MYTRILVVFFTLSNTILESSWTVQMTDWEWTNYHFGRRGKWCAVPELGKEKQVFPPRNEWHWVISDLIWNVKLLTSNKYSFSKSVRWIISRSTQHELNSISYEVPFTSHQTQCSSGWSPTENSLSQITFGLLRSPTSNKHGHWAGRQQKYFSSNIWEFAQSHL